jgi:hypothetical protein
VLTKQIPQVRKKIKITKRDSATENQNQNQNLLIRIGYWYNPFVHACWICIQILKCLCKISMQISSSNLLHIQSEPTISEIKFVLQISSSLDNFAKPMTDSIKGLQSIQF